MFDFGKKKYKQGIVDGAKPFEEKFRKQEEAIREVGNRIDSGLTKIDENIDALYDHLTSKEKAELYNLNTPLKIEDLDEEEARFLVASLFQLSAQLKSPSDYQKMYLRAVIRELGISQPQTSINLNAIDAITDINAQKAILQTVLEYLYLGDGTWNLTEDQEEFIDSFNLSSKNLRETVNRIETICSAVGYQGLAEKYGFYPEEDVLSKTDNSSFGLDDNVQATEESIYEFIETIEKYHCGERVRETQNYIVADTSSGDRLFRLDKRTGEQEEFYWTYSLPYFGSTSFTTKYKILGDQIIYEKNHVIWLIDVATMEPPEEILSLNGRRFELSFWDVSDKWLVYSCCGPIELYDWQERYNVPLNFNGIPLDAITATIEGDKLFFLGDKSSNTSFYYGGIFCYDIGTGKLDRVLDCSIAARASSMDTFMTLCGNDLVLYYEGTYQEKCAHICWVSLDDKKPVLNHLGDDPKYSNSLKMVYRDGIAYVDFAHFQSLYFIDFKEKTTSLLTTRKKDEFGYSHPYTRIGDTIYYFDISENGNNSFEVYGVDIR